MQFEREVHPTSYLYDAEFKKLLSWGRELVIPELFCKYDSVLVYSKGKDSATEKEVMQELTTYNGLKLGDYKRIFSDTATNENMYVIYTNRILSSRLMESKSSIYCDFEKLTDDNSGYVATDNKHVFSKGNQVSQKEHHSGLNSILLDSKNPYGADMLFNVRPGDFIDITIWRKAASHGGGIVLSASDPEKLYRGDEAVINTAENGWEQIECKCKIPDDYKEPTVHFYLYYPIKGEAYFDDLTISIYPMLLNSTNIISNLEKLSADKSQFISDDGNYAFQRADQISTTEHHSGKNSILLSKTNPYGLDLILTVKPGDSVSASVWRKSADKASTIVFSAIDTKYFYTGGSTIISTDANGWEEIEAGTKIPLDYKEPTLHFYVSVYGNKDTYFDDVAISVYPKK